MPTLRLRPSPPDATGRVPVRIELDLDGRRCHAEALTGAVYSEDDRRDLHWYLEQYLEQTYPPHPARVARIEGRMVALGERLFADLFGASADGRALWAAAEPELSRTRVEICGPDALVAALPWDWLRKPDAVRPVAVEAASFVRTPPGFRVVGPASAPDQGGRLRVLLVICRPALAADVPFRSVAGRLLKAAAEAERACIDLTLLRPPTFERLETVLREASEAGTSFHIVHFDGHGLHDDLGSGAQGYLMFESPDDEDNQVPVGGRRLGRLLSETGVPVLVLNACRSGYADGAADQGQAFGSLAQTVTATAGIGVLAMRYNVYVVTASQYVGTLYQRLAAGVSLSEAAASARRDLFEHPERAIAGEAVALQDWVVPVLYEPAPIRLLAGDAAGSGNTVPKASDDLPPPPAIGFIGRDETLVLLDRAFDRHRVVLLHAYAGSGKTCAAVEFGRWYRDTGGIEGPVWFDSFEEVKTLPRLLDRIGNQFETDLEAQGVRWFALDEDQRRAVALRVLAQVPVLWIWDNVEPVTGFPVGAPSRWSAGEQAALRTFLAEVADGGGLCKVLLTSRRDERSWLGDLPARVAPQPTPMAERMAMAEVLARRHGAGFSWSLKPLLDYSQGNPMTLSILLGQVLRHGPPAAVDIDAYVDRLRTGEAGFDDDLSLGRDRSLGASLAYGFETAFDDKERRRLALLHLFQGVADAGTLAAMVLGGSEDEWRALLNRAAEIGLLARLGDDRYNLHPALS